MFMLFRSSFVFCCVTCSCINLNEDLGTMWIERWIREHDRSTILSMPVADRLVWYLIHHSRAMKLDLSFIV